MPNFWIILVRSRAFQRANLRPCPTRSCRARICITFWAASQRPLGGGAGPCARAVRKIIYLLTRTLALECLRNELKCPKSFCPESNWNLKENEKSCQISSNFIKFREIPQNIDLEWKFQNQKFWVMLRMQCYCNQVDNYRFSTLANTMVIFVCSKTARVMHNVNKFKSDALWCMHQNSKYWVEISFLFYTTPCFHMLNRISIKFDP